MKNIMRHGPKKENIDFCWLRDLVWVSIGLNDCYSTYDPWTCAGHHQPWSILRSEPTKTLSVSALRRSPPFSGRFPHLSCAKYHHEFLRQTHLKVPLNTRLQIKLYRIKQSKHYFAMGRFRCRYNSYGSKRWTRFASGKLGIL